MSNEDFEKQTVSRLSSIETQLKMLVASCSPCRAKIDKTNDIANEALQSAKSAHHRIDTMELARKELKQDLEKVIDDKIDGIYHTAGIVGGIIGGIISIISLLISKIWR